MATGSPTGPLQNPTPPPRDRDGTKSEDISRVAREKAGAVWNDAKDTAGAKLGEQKDSAASSLGSFANALRKAAHESGSQDQDGIVRVADLAADGLERLSGTLRNKDLDTLVGDVESFARRQPAAFFGVAIAAGFLAVRFVKSSRRSPAGEGDARASSQYPGVRI
jgi:hypothetical protein